MAKKVNDTQINQQVFTIDRDSHFAISGSNIVINNQALNGRDIAKPIPNKKLPVKRFRPADD